MTVYSARPITHGQVLYTFMVVCEQNRIVHTIKFEVELINNKKSALKVLYY